MAAATTDVTYQSEGNFYPQDVINLTNLINRLIFVFPTSEDELDDPMIIQNFYVDEAQDCQFFTF